jgi:hypothetical protein
MSVIGPSRQAVFFGPSVARPRSDLFRPAGRHRREALIANRPIGLRSLGLERYEAAFHENEITEKVLPSLTAEDLKDLGVVIVGHRLGQKNVESR